MRRIFSSSSLLAFSVCWLTGCAVGPDFSKPDAPDVTAYDSTPSPQTTADGAQTLNFGQDIPSEWWKLFHSNGLNSLICQAIKENPDLATAEASLRAAEANLSAEDAALFPVVSGSFSQERQKTSPASFGGFAPSFTYSLYNASVGVSYGLDIWGGTRRAIEELQAQADEVGFEKEATYLTLTSNIVTAAIQEASLRDQIAATKEIISDEEKVLQILRARFEAGAVSKSVVLEQQATLATAKTQLPPLEHQLVVTRHLLSALVGQLPSNEPAAKFTLNDLSLPQIIPVTLPSKLVEQRPDVREAEENLHAASADIGVAISNRLPQIALSADIGSMSSKLQDLFTPGTGVWDFSSSAAVTLFDAGALEDKEDAARANYDAAAAQYRKAVLTAFQNVADALHALQSDALSLNARTDAEKAASDSLSLLQTQFSAGAVTMADLLNAELTEQQAKAALVQAKAQRYADTAALFAALGGGWWNRDNPSVTVDTSGPKTPAPDASEKGTQ